MTEWSIKTDFTTGEPRIAYDYAGDEQAELVVFYTV